MKILPSRSNSRNPVRMNQYPGNTKAELIALVGPVEADRRASDLLKGLGDVIDGGLPFTYVMNAVYGTAIGCC